RYRRTVELLARGSRFTELEVARRAVGMSNRAECARAAAADQEPPLESPQPRHCHVGYYLIDRGRSDLESDIGFRPPVGERVIRTVLAHPQAVYFSALGVVTALAL